MVLAVVPTGDRKAYAQDKATGMANLSGLSPRLADRFIATGNKMLAVAEVRINSINTFTAAQMNTVNSTRFGK